MGEDGCRRLPRPTTISQRRMGSAAPRAATGDQAGTAVSRRLQRTALLQGPAGRRAQAPSQGWERAA